MDSFRRLQKTAGIPSRLIGLGAGVLMGGSIGSSLADILHTGPVGIGSEELWKHEIKEHIRNQASARALKKAQEKVRRVGTAGAFAGGILALPFAITKKKPLIGLAGVLLGRQLTRTLAKKKHPLADPKLSAMDLLFSKYRGLLNDEEAATWKQIMTSDYLKKNPEQRNQLIGHFVSKARQNPAYAEYERKKKLGKTLGMIGGAGLMLAGMRFGKKGPISELKPGWITKNRFPKLKHMFSGSTYWPYVALGTGVAGTGIASAIVGGKRAKLPENVIRKNALERGLNELGFGSLFYGGIMSPSEIGAW